MRRRREWEMPHRLKGKRVAVRLPDGTLGVEGTVLHVFTASNGIQLAELKLTPSDRMSVFADDLVELPGGEE